MNTMLFLADFSVIQPNVGMLFWTTVIFLLVLWFLSRYAYKPIVDGLKKREDGIQEALDAAQEAEKKMAAMKAENEKLLQEAREERAQILRDAKNSGKKIVSDAKVEAKAEAQNVLSNARQDIENEKRKAVEEIKNELGVYAVNIAEKIIKKNLDNRESHEELVRNMVDDIHLN